MFSKDEWVLSEQQRGLSLLGIDNLEGQKRVTLKSDRPGVMVSKMLRKLEKLEAR